MGAIHTTRSLAFRSVKQVLFHTRLRDRVFHKYDDVYMFDPDQLLFLCTEIERLRDVPGIFLEIGCAKGHTTVFLNRYAERANIQRRYVAVDTFAGFTDEDTQFEKERRGKSRYRFDEFRNNSQEWFDYTMTLNEITGVESWKMDIGATDLGEFDEIAFCLLDVDFYKPTLHALPLIYERLVPGGVIIVDDCSDDNPKWDGALQAYQEFVGELGRQPEIVHRKLGVLRKQS